MRAFSVHVLTASGAALALLALILATQHRWTEMLVTLGAALIVDGIDGPLARRWRAAKLLPRWSGDALDFVVDFNTYVFVPAFAIAMSGLLPFPLAVGCAIVVVITGALYFADREMKTDDNYFKGFPAVWNVIVFYFLLLRPDGWIIVAAVAALAALTFAPIKFVHPLRVTKWRAINIVLLAVWAIMAVAAVWANLHPPVWVSGVLLATAVYFFAAGMRLPSR